jgi:hypothetical protein
MKSPIARRFEAAPGVVRAPVFIGLLRGTTSNPEKALPIWPSSSPIGLADVRADRLRRLAQLVFVQEIIATLIENAIRLVSYKPCSLYETRRWSHDRKVGPRATDVSSESRIPNQPRLAVSDWPLAVGRQPLAVSPWPSALGRQPLAVSRWPSAVGRQPLAVSPWPSALGRQPLAVSPWPSALTLTSLDKTKGEPILLLSETKGAAWQRNGAAR